MTAIFRDPTAGWAALLVFLLPIAIIAIGEVEERLRQRDSPLQHPVSILRTWVVPLFAIWSLAQVIGSGSLIDALVVVVGSGLVVALGAVALTTARIFVAALLARPPRDGRRSIPRLVLAMPRLIILLVTGWVLIAGVWNIDLSAALTALGVTSLIVSLALQDTLGGIASGFTLLADQPFQPGDWIRTGDLEGRVVDVNWRSSRIETRDGDLVVVPNGQLATATITNFDEPTRLHRIVVPVQVAYANSPTRAKEMLVAAAAATPGVLESPPPNAVVTQIDDPLMGYEVHLWIDDYAIAPRVKSDFGSLVWYHSHRFDVPLPSPAQDLFLWDGRQEASAGLPEHRELVQAVRSSPLFDVLPDDEVDRLAAAARLVRYSQGEEISKGLGDDVGVVRTGLAQLVMTSDDSADLPVFDFQLGDMFGILDQIDVPVSVVAVTDCDVVRIGSDAARSAISRSQALSVAIDQMVNSRQRRIQRLVRRVEEQAALELAAATETDAAVDVDDPESAADESSSEESS